MESVQNKKQQSYDLKKKEETDHAYIEKLLWKVTVFKTGTGKGPEKNSVKGNHAGCHVWFTDGKYIFKKEKISAENRYLRNQAQLQMERNRIYYYKNQKLYQSIITQLSSQIRNCMMVHQQPDILPGRSGRLILRECGDRNMSWMIGSFMLIMKRKSHCLRWIFFLDASASRLQYQEMIAAQGVILSESLQACHIPVRVSEFCSVRGYTVLRILKAFEEKKK